MTIKHFYNAKIFSGAHNLSGDMNRCDLTVDVEENDITTFGTSVGAAWRGFYPGMKTANFSAEGFFQAVASSSAGDYAYFSKLGSTSAPAFTVCGGGLEEDVAYFGEAVEFGYNPITSSIGEMLAFDMSARNITPIVRGYLMVGSSVANTTTGASTGDEIGPMASGETLYAILHVTNAAGTSSTLTVTVQGATASSFAAPTTHIAFTALSVAGSEWSTSPVAYTTSNLDTHYRVVYTIAGASADFTFAAAVGIQ